MSGCCGPGPVIMSAPAVSRVDVEGSILCDVLPDGSVAGQALVEAVYDTNSGERVGTRVVDPVTGADYTPQGVLGPCPQDEACASPTTPTTTVGLCLADGTPIAVTVVRDCDGVVTSEGWLNLTTGAWSAGAPPVGTVACGSSQSIEVSGTFCDVDGNGDVVGLVLIEYSYDSEGAIDSVRLVDAVTGGTYVPTGTITTCPAGVAQPERDLLQLCDTAGDGTVTAFVRDYARDENGAITGHTDYGLDGALYTPAGAVGLCAEPCGSTTVLALCDTTGSGPIALKSRLAFTDVDPMPWIIPGGGVIHQPSLVSGQPFFDGGTVTIEPPPGGEAAEPTHRVFAARIDVAGAAQICNPPTDVTLTLTAHIVNLGPNPGQATCGRWHLHNGATIVASQSALSVSVNGFRDLSITGTVPWADLLAGNVHISMDLETQHFGPKSWTASQFDVMVTPTLVDPCDTSTGEVTQFLRTLVTDCSGETVTTRDTELDGVTPYTVAGEVGVCDGGGSSAEECRDTSTVLVCDVPADGTVTITPTIVDSTLEAVGQTQFQTHPGPWAPLWSGGTLVYPAGAGPAQEHLAVVGQITADMSECEGASGTLTISVRIRNDGPNPGQQWDGALRLFRGTTLIASHDALTWAPVGWEAVRTVTAPVTAADIAGGDIRVALILETFHLDAKSWTASEFTASLELEGCEATTSTQFLRTLTVDCETGDVVATTDTTLDGQPYTVTGEVGQCVPASPPDECRNCEQTVLCDVTEEGTVSFLRTVCRDCTGAVISTLDTELDGTTPYGIVGTAGACNASAACETFTLCDSSPAPVELGAVALEDPSRWRTLICPTCAAADNPTLPGGLQPLFDGGSVDVPLTPTSAATGSHHWAAGALTAAGCSCPDAEVTLSVSVDFLNNGPAAQQGGGTGVFLYNGDTLVGSAGTLAAAGTTDTLTVTGTVPLADVQAGNVVLAFQVEGGQQGNQKTWTLSNFQVEATTDCGRSFLRTVCRDAAGEVVSQTDTLDGVTSYAPVGDVQPCSGPDAVCDQPEPCETAGVQVLRLCDLDPSVEADEDGRRCAVPFLRHLAYDCAGALLGFHDTGLDGTTPYTPVQVVDCQCATGEGVTSSIEVPWVVVSVVEDPDGLPQQDFIYTVSPEDDPSRIGTIHVHVSRQAGGACGAYDINNLIFSNSATYTLTLDAVAQEMSYLRVDLQDFDSFEPVGISGGTPEPDRLGGTAGWNAAHTRIVPSESNGVGYMYWDNPPETVSWFISNTGGGTSCSMLSFQGMTVEPGGCCGGDDSTTSCRECGPVSTGVRSGTGTDPVDLAAEFPGLQSVSLAVLAGSVAVTMSDGTGVEIPAGVTLTWSVSTGTDTALAAAAFAGADPSASYLLNWTYTS